MSSATETRQRVSDDKLAELIIEIDRRTTAAHLSYEMSAVFDLRDARAEIVRLREALIQCGLNVGAGLGEGVTTDFLMLVPQEVALVVARLRKEAAP